MHDIEAPEVFQAAHNLLGVEARALVVKVIKY